MRKADHAALALLLVVVLLFFSDVLILGKAFYIRDVARIYYPERWVLRTLLEGGAFPFWNSHQGGGQPLAANPTAAVFYPPQWLVLLPDFQTGVALEVVLHFLIGAAGMFVFLRRLGLARAACAFGSFTFAMSGLLLSLASLFPCLFAIVWLPWLGFAVERFIDGRSPADFALAALFLGIILIVGEPSTILQSGVLMAAYMVTRLRAARAFALAAAICVAALLVGSAQIIPAIDHMRDSGRAEDISYREVTLQSLDPARPLEMIVPNLFTHFTAGAIYSWGSSDPGGVPWIFSWYAGLLAAALIGAGFVRRIRGWQFVAAVSAVSYLVALGKHGPLFPLLYRVGLRFLRYPEKWFMPASFVLIVFAAIASDQFVRDALVRRVTSFAAVALTCISAATLLFAGSPLFPRTFHLTGSVEDILREARSGAVTTLAASIALLLILQFRERPRIAIPLLAVFVIADLGPRVFALAPRIDRAFYDPPPVAHTLPAGARIYSDADWRLRLLPQPHVVDRDRWLRLRNGMLPEMQSLWGFDSVLELDVTATNLLPSIEFSRRFWAAQLGGHPRLVLQFLAMAGTTAVAELRDATSAADPIRIVPLGHPRYYFADQVVRGPIVPASPRAAFTDIAFTPARGTILRAAEHPNALDFDVDASGDALLVVAVTRHKYWRAAVDGVPAALHPTNIAFQSVVVPRGRHNVALRYRNPLIVIFGMVSLVSTAVLLSIAVAGALRSRAPRPPSPR